MIVRVVCVLAGSIGAAAHDDAHVLERIQGSADVTAPLVEIEHRDWLSVGHRLSALRMVEAQDAISDGDIASAARLYTQAVQADPGNDAAWRMLARLARTAGDRETEHDAWSYRVTLVPDDFEGLEALAQHAVLRGDDSAAARMLLRRRMQQPDDDLMTAARWDLALAVALTRLGEGEAAHAYAEPARKRLLALASKDPVTRNTRRRWAMLVQALFDEGSPLLVRDLAVERLSSGHLDHPADRGRWTSFAIVADAVMDGGDVSRSVIEMSPPDDVRLATSTTSPLTRAEALLDASSIHSTLGNQGGAVDLLLLALSEDPQHAMALNNLGYLLLERNHEDPQAPGLIERAWAIDPVDPAIMDSYGWLRFLQGKLRDEPDAPGALSILRGASKLLDGLDPVVLEHLGDAEYAAGMAADARRTWRQALAILENPRYRQRQVQVYAAVQQQDWGVRVIDPVELYDLSLGDMVDRLRSKLAGTQEASE